MKQLDGRGTARTGTALGDVRIRPYGVTDHDRLRRMSERLSPASLYTRFFSGTPRLPDHYVGSAHFRLPLPPRQAPSASATVGAPRRARPGVRGGRDPDS